MIDYVFALLFIYIVDVNITLYYSRSLNHFEVFVNLVVMIYYGIPSWITLVIKLSSSCELSSFLT